MRRIAVALAAIIGALLSGPTSTARQGQPRELTLEDRVRAQEAIERVYYSHQIGATRTFEEAVPAEVLANRIRNYMSQSVALEELWHVPVTPEALRAEMERIARDTRFPDRLGEINDALDNDAVLIQETFARSTLVDRLVRHFFTSDERLTATDPGFSEGARDKDYSVWWRRARADFPPERFHSLLAASMGSELDPIEPSGQGAQFSPASFGMGAGASATAGEASQECGDHDRWDNGSLDDLPAARASHAAVWTGTEMLVWGGHDGVLIAGGGRYNPLTDTWAPLSNLGSPAPSASPTAVWTGQEMIVWGGLVDFDLSRGGRYNPSTDTWSEISPIDAPIGRYNHSAVWTGTEMIIWGGIDCATDCSEVSTGARYNPAADQWTLTSMAGAPASRNYHSAVWTGDEMIVWGGWSLADPLGTGAAYDPALNSWRALSSSGAPSPRQNHTAVWTGDEMIVWGGSPGDLALAFADGGRYRPGTDTWTLVSGIGAPTARELHASAWTGSELLIWGGRSATDQKLRTGARYSPLNNTWTPMSLVNAPPERAQSSAVWTGQEMIVWGGFIDVDHAGVHLDTGGRYAPSADTWTPTAGSRAPAGRTEHTAVWTGNLMIVWGGDGLDTGGRYDPLVDDWTFTTTQDAPSGRYGHTAVWTGDEMIVWGGLLPYQEFDSGGRYDPHSDTWRPTSFLGAPSARGFHTAIWTGSQMIVWGGYSDTVLAVTGGRYSPSSDTWGSISLLDAPVGRFFHTAVWTGARMIVWGGVDIQDGISQDSGGEYDPVLDRWTETPVTGAPEARQLHTATWTGEHMVVAGGEPLADDATLVSLYDPATRTWHEIPTSPPSGLFSVHSAVWTGQEVIIWGGYTTPTAGTGGSGTGFVLNPCSGVTAPVSLRGAPSARAGHTAVWTGAEMIIWGGYPRLRNGGRLLPIATVDADCDDYRSCDGDCDEGDPERYPGAPETCNGKDDDCDGTVSTEESDADGDGYAVCADDCDDQNAAAHPGAPELPGNTQDENCDGTIACDPLAEWETRGRFVKCVEQQCRGLVASGLVTAKQCSSLVSKAKRLRPR